MVTFLHDVSPQQYPQQRRGGPAHAANRESPKTGVLPQNGSNAAAAGLVATLAD